MERLDSNPRPRVRISYDGHYAMVPVQGGRRYSPNTPLGREIIHTFTEAELTRHAFVPRPRDPDGWQQDRKEILSAQRHGSHFALESQILEKRGSRWVATEQTFAGGVQRVRQGDRLLIASYTPGG